MFPLRRILSCVGLGALLLLTSSLMANPAPWVADQGDGTYRNPVLHADYSDPDAVRVGEDFWMTSSSFSHVPGLPILHSRDLVNWTLVGHALSRLVPEEAFRTPQHGKGVWAPSIRHHAGKFWIYYPDPDYGIFLVTAADPRGPWSAPVLVKGGRGLIDPCPLWDDDGRVYLVHGYARSRAGFANVLTIAELSADGGKVIDDFGFVIHGDRIPGFTTLEGPKFLKRDGWYYVLAPAGGVKPGWQAVFRARDIRGPYEHKIVLAQGSTPVNGPHQGALVDTAGGEWWFLHFQDKDAYGRIVHLQPVRWQDGWPLMGTAAAAGAPAGEIPVKAADGRMLVASGEPVLRHVKPKVPPQPIAVPATSDEFDDEKLGLQWQWQANPEAGWFSLTERRGFLRLHVRPKPRPNDLYDAANLLLQKFPAEEFVATTKLSAAQVPVGGRAGLVVFGQDYAVLAVRPRGERVAELELAVSRRNPGGTEEAKVVRVDGYTPGRELWLRVTVRAGARCQFAYSVDGKEFTSVGEEFEAKPGRWVGAKVGVFATTLAQSSAAEGFADFDFFRVE